MMECICDASSSPAWCETHGRWMGKTALRIWQSGDGAKIARYFRNGVAKSAAPKSNGQPACVYLGEWIREESGAKKRKDCTGCAGTVRLTIYSCAKFGETTLADCKACGEYVARTA